MNSRLFQFSENGKCRRISLELISWGPHSSLEREKEIRRRLFTSSIKLAIRHFHVVVVQEGEEMYKIAWCTCKVVVLGNKPIAFLTSWLPSPASLLKLPIVIQCDENMRKNYWNVALIILCDDTVRLDMNLCWSHQKIGDWKLYNCLCPGVSPIPQSTRM